MTLAGIHEIAALLGVSRQRAHTIAQKPTFPEPLARLAAGPVWRLGDVERWVAANRSRP